MKLLFFIFAHVVGYLHAQNYFKYFKISHEAENNIFNGDYKIAEKQYEFLIKKYKLTAKHYFYLGFLKLNNKDTLSAKINFINSVKNGGHIIEWIDDFKEKHNTMNVSLRIISELNKYEDSIITSRDITLINKIKYFDSVDQNNRNYEKDQIDLKNDSILQIELLSFFKKNGIPNLYIYGDIFTTIFLHISNKTVFKKFKKFLFNQVKKGTIPPYYYCSMVDKYLWSYNLKTEYETFGHRCKDERCKKEVMNNKNKIGLSIYNKGPCIYPIK